jgi:hypothetical protein
MSQEQTEILQMLAGGAITVEEAERLLNALSEGQMKAEAAAGGDSPRKQQGVQDALHSVREAVAGIGPMVARMVGEISTEMHKDRNFPGESDAEELPDLKYEENRFHIPDGAKLYIRSDKDGGPSGGDLQIEGVEGEHCELHSSEARNLRVLRSSSGPVIRWSGGPLKVSTPATTALIYAYTLAGELNVTRLHCPVVLKSMGGDVKLLELSRRCSVKTVGGNVRLHLGQGGCESSEVRTMGGNIRVEVPVQIPGTEILATTVGGSIIVEDGLGEVKKGVNLGWQKAQVHLGEGQPGSYMKVNSLGGNIEIRRARHE